ncbi:MAG: glycosyltransferase family 4 protein [Patescibacteria group bacterium]|jgi:glycosyltransferase involved in cell wall biosynthesis
MKNKLLIITQKVDKNDPVLGFFHGWLLEFAKKYEKITVICLVKAEYNLPSNIKVLSLGKENRISRLNYVINLYKYIWQERANYDQVFVHMNPEYLVLAGCFWRCWGKRIGFWYNHAKGGIKAKLAIKLAHKVFYTSSYAFAARYQKSQVMPVGIATDIFKINKLKQVSEPFRLLSLGRISPVKDLETLVAAAKILAKENFDFLLDIYGTAPVQDEDYYKKIREQAKTLEVDNKIIFHSSVVYQQTPDIYNSHDLFINLTPSGSFDKTILEAMACGTLVLICNKSLHDDLPDNFLFKEHEAIDLARKIKAISLIDKQKYQEKFRQYVLEKHSVDILISRLQQVLGE